jgi:rubrerythrin
MNIGEEGKELRKSNKRHVQRWEEAKESMAGGWIFQICPVRGVAHVTDNTPRACDALSTGEFVATTLHLS